MMVYCSRREQRCPFSYRTCKHITVAAGVDSLGSCVLLNISYCELFITDTDVYVSQRIISYTAFGFRPLGQFEVFMVYHLMCVA